MQAKDFAQESAQRLWTDGYVAFDFARQFGDELWRGIQNAYQAFTETDRFKAQKQEFVNNPPAIEIDDLEKRFLFRLLNSLKSQEVYEYPQDSIWMNMATHPYLLETARAYFGGGNPQLAYHDLWYTMPQSEIKGDDRPRVASQKWHIDAEAEGVPRRIFKAFLYFNDIDEQSGPLEIYVSGASMNPEKLVTLCVPKGTMVFVDTGRFLHRGGYCLTKPRMLSLWYYTNASGMTIPPLRTSGRFTASKEALEAVGRA